MRLPGEVEKARLRCGRAFLFPSFIVAGLRRRSAKFLIGLLLWNESVGGNNLAFWG